MSPVFPNSIEVFDLAENQDMSPIELDPEKLAHKFKELQIKHAVTQAEIQLLKRKLAHAEQDKLRWRMERAQLEQNIRDSKRGWRNWRATGWRHSPCVRQWMNT